jgi:thioredoxin 1
MAEGINPPSVQSIARGIALLLLVAALSTSGIWIVEIWRRQTIGSRSTQPVYDSVKAVLQLHKPTIAEFGSDKCAGCREMTKIVDVLSRQHGACLNAVAVDVLANRDYLRLYRVQALPTQIFFDAEGREIGRHMGVIGEEEILRRLGVDASRSGGT